MLVVIERQVLCAWRTAPSHREEGSGIMSIIGLILKECRSYML